MEPPTDAPIRVLAVAHEPADPGPGVEVETAADLAAALERLAEGGIDVALVAFAPSGGSVGAIAERTPAVPIVAVTRGDDEAAAALDAGALDFVPDDADQETLRRAFRYATSISRLQVEIHRRQIVDELTGLYNARGFEQLALHHLRIADRTKEPVVLLFVRLDHLQEARRTFGSAEEARLLAEAASALHQAVRGSDVLARVGEDAFCVLLTGDATGAEALVLSRLVEAVAVHNARAEHPQPLSLSVGAAAYDPTAPASLDELMSQADRRMHAVDGGATTP
jgi:diguanylate cyclase (GGDEF)-like protein